MELQCHKQDGGCGTCALIGRARQETGWTQAERSRTLAQRGSEGSYASIGRDEEGVEVEALWAGTRR
ncbi:hypothetical protein NDU88_001463 [Pleurodeles waltl]|uniref:Uncharacterized protein n=1 Tax=Pleurodeles waltl TaxID=8319 RepID=A0AAV7R963_PLEWA|nr:hypothetical protein NDU88_001463 [Pleurodeles waltl]